MDRKDRNYVGIIKLLSIVLSALPIASCSAGDKDGLVAYWKCDEAKGDRLLDSSGNGNHGTIHGAAWTKGRINGGMQFDGVDDYVKVPRSVGLDGITKEITLMCWIKTPLTGRHCILGSWPCDNSNQRCLVLDVDSDGKLARFALSPNGVPGTWHSFPRSIKPGKWTHIAATSDGEKMKIYVNGRPDPSTCNAPKPGIYKTKADLHIGAWQTGEKKWESFFKGIMDEIRIYSRALTHDEILQHYLAGSPKGTVSGRIVRKDGKPIRGAKVNAGFFHTTTDGEGKYRIAVPTGTYEVIASMKGYERGIKSNVNAAEGKVGEVNIALDEDNIPPSITKVKVEDIDGVNATILWKTTEKCRYIVRYGISTGKYNKKVEDKTYVDSHRATLTKLVPGSKYYYILECADGAGNLVKSMERIFNTQIEEHPFLIVRKSDYAALRARAAKSPWKEMKAEAISYIKSKSYNPKKNTFVGSRYSNMSSIVSKGALAYILDPDNKEQYIKKITDALSHWDKLYVLARDWRGHNGQYYLNADWQAAFFNSVLALDVIYNDLPPSQRSDLESKLNKVADWYYSKSGSVYHYANYGLWAIYRNDRQRIQSARSKWRENYFQWLSSDGVFLDGPGYAICSANSRHGKMHFHHILQIAGLDKEWYSDPRIASFYEWLYGAGFSPFRRMISFADTGPNRAYCPFDPGVGRFSMKALANLAWCANGRIPSATLFHYVIMDKPLSSPVKPLSRIWPDGCAAFWEDNPSDRSLMGVLWNCMNTRDSDGHAHKEVNALHLCAYGEHVLRNAGYVGWGNGAHGFSWEYVHHTAVSANTVLIDGKDHTEKKGAGITEGFTSPRFDYASGYSKDALPNGKHRRNFCFVHPQDGRCGYWVLFDEVKADKPASKINVVLHPNSDKCFTVADKQEYKWKVSPFTYSGHDVFLNIFLATSPESVEIKPGLLANMGGEKNCFVGKYLYSTYKTDGDGRRNIVTVLFPQDSTHAKAKMTRISGGGYSGAIIDLGDSITDVAIESSGNKAVTHKGVSFRGLAALYRIKGKSGAGVAAKTAATAPIFYFVRKGRSFNDGAEERRGFESDKAVSIYVKGGLGRITSPGAEVTFYSPGIKGVLIDGKAVRPVGSGNGWVKVAVGKGAHDLKFR